MEMVNAKVAAQIAKQKIEEIVSTGSDVVVTSCQQCVRTMMTYVSKKWPMKAFHY